MSCGLLNIRMDFIFKLNLKSKIKNQKSKIKNQNNYKNKINTL